jgi:cystathionine beta-lyase/cystathionine gamma-synthase
MTRKRKTAAGEASSHPVSQEARNKDGATAARKNGGAPGQYKIRTRLIHGSPRSSKWDYSHHVIPPITSSATFRLSSTQRGAKGFFEFACDSIDTTRQLPIYIYDRLDEPTRGMLEENLALAEEGEMAVTFATGMAAITAAICCLVRAGDEVLAHDTLYGCTYSFLTNWARARACMQILLTCAMRGRSRGPSLQRRALFISRRR